METPNSNHWSDLPFDILRSLFERLSFVDFHRAKIVCTNWYLCSKQTLHKTRKSPWLMLFPEDGCVLYNPDEDRNVVDLRGLLWVDEKKKEEYTVVWFFDTGANYIAFCKNREDHYRTIPTRFNVRRELRGISDMVLGGDILYVYTIRRYIRVLDLSGQEGYNDVVSNTDLLSPLYPASPPSSDDETTYDGAFSRHNIAVTTSGEVLLVESIVYDDSSDSKIPTIGLRLYKKVPNPDPDEFIYRPNVSVEVDSLGHEALLLDLGITVPADRTLGIEPNSIYFTRHDRLRNCKLKPSCRARDICVFNLKTKNVTRFPSLSYLKAKDALWFLPS
ncbi:unnamed protein product [Arabidopsis halleri]